MSGSRPLVREASPASRRYNLTSGRIGLFKCLTADASGPMPRQQRLVEVADVGRRRRLVDPKMLRLVIGAAVGAEEEVHERRDVRVVARVAVKYGVCLPSSNSANSTVTRCSKSFRRCIIQSINRKIARTSSALYPKVVPATHELRLCPVAAHWVARGPQGLDLSASQQHRQ